ncbi:MAG: molybdopterin-dependent oxidoreductase [Eggerthellaceae bacterium]|nr:molybdopterin-dependent oxidoreductase [Eggerthellaceae bacterium]
MTIDAKEPVTCEEGECYRVRTCAWSPPGDHPVGCGLYIYVKDGKVVKTEGDPSHPITNGRLCPRCIALDEVMYHPDRLTHPMVRDRADRGKDAWKQVSWDEAYDLIESRVREIWDTWGAETIFTITGTGRESTLYAPVYGPAVLNTCNGGGTQPFSGQACYGPRATIANFLLGAGYPEMDWAQYFPDRYDDPRYEVPKYILVWGKDPLYSSPDGLFGHSVIDLMKRGSKLIVVDPRVTWLAAHAEYHLQLRPGTDAAIGLAMINVLIEEDLYNHEFVERWCFGFDNLVEHVKPFTPEWAEPITWVPADVIRGAMRAFAAGAPSTALWGVAVDQIKNGVQAGQCFLDVLALCGYFDVPGAVILQKPASFIGKWRYEMGSTISEEMEAKRVVDPHGKYRLFNTGASIGGIQGDTLLNWLEMELDGFKLDQLPYQLKACWIIGSNVLACEGARPMRWYEAMKDLEFIVAQDIFMTPTIMGLADVVLPLSTFAEHDGIVTPHFGRNQHFLGAMNKALEPIDTKSDLEILIDMGKRLRPEIWDHVDDVHDFFDQQLRSFYDYGYETLREQVVIQPEFSYRKYETGLLRSDGEPGFDTPTGMIELDSVLFPHFGEQSMPYYEEPEYGPEAVTPEQRAEFPLVYTTGGRNITMFHSEHRQIPSLRAINHDPMVTIHPATAAANGIHAGDWVRVEGIFGSCVLKAKVNKQVNEKLVHLEHAWWFPEEDGEAPNLFGVWKANVNNLMPLESVGVTGYGAPYKNGICKISRVDSQEG